jgi:DNA-binding response OmpR family regulator
MRLLIVEENAGLLRLLRTLLSKRGDEISECVEGKQALHLCAREQPDWVVLDMNLAGTDGLSLTRQIRSAWPQIRVLLLVDEEDIRLRDRAVQAGAADLIAKERLSGLLLLLSSC